MQINGILSNLYDIKGEHSHSNVMENVKAYHNTKFNDNKNPVIWIRIYLSQS